MIRDAVPSKVLARVGARSLNLLTATAGGFALAVMLGGCGDGGTDGPDPTPTPAADRASIGYRLLRGVDRLDEPKTGVARLYSSHNRNDGSNIDFNQYIGRDADGSYIMADHNGPGVITRLWMTARIGSSLQNSSPGFSQQSVLNVYVDGSPTPLFSINPNRFFAGDLFPFVAPLVGQHTTTKGFYSYVPISFASHVKVTLLNPFPPGAPYPTERVFYQIDVLDLSGGSAVTASPTRQGDALVLSSDDQAAHAEALAQWRDPLNFANQMTQAQQTKSFAGPVAGNAVLADITGAGRIRGIRLHTAGVSSADLEKVHLKIRWDGEATPSVDLPLGSGWGNYFNRGQFQSLVQGSLADGTLYLRFPMPFRQSAHLELASTAAGSLPISGEVFHDTGTQRADARYFHAVPAAASVQNGTRFQMAQANGAGHIVAIHLAVNVQSDPQALEGDEYINCDGQNLHKGTGTEDYFNAHWFFEGGTRSEPLSGTTSVGSRFSPDVDTFRFMVPDMMPFANNLRVDIENANAPGNTDDYRSVVFFYLAH